jgi:two-component system sensor kinase FixL
MAPSEERPRTGLAQRTAPGTHGSLSGYGLALGALAAALLFRYLARDSLGLKVPYLQFYPAILVAAWYGGFGPGVLTTLLAAAAAMYFFLPPAGFAVQDPSDQLSLGIFVATGLVISWLNQRLHQAEDAQRTAAATATVRAEARWHAIVDSAVDGIVVIDARGRVEAFNPAAERLFGYTAQEVLGRNVNLLMPSPYREEHDTYLSRYKATGRARIIGIGREVQGLRKDGSTFPLHLSVGQITVQGERKFTGILHDLSGRVEMEGKLREQAALAKLGEMAAVIAHEVKNPLAGIRGAIQVFSNRISQEDPNSRILKEIVSRIDSLDQMMKDLLLFARPPTPKRAAIDVVPLVTTTASLLSQDPALRRVDVEVEGAAPPVSADPEMLRIVFQNLLINGAHAMHGKGRIRVAVDTIDSTCRIAFIDAGPGIPSDIREKIFTPFFTTKSRGSGLGLPTAKRLVEAHNGQIAVDCPPTGGTIVIVRLPMGTS